MAGVPGRIYFDANAGVPLIAAAREALVATLAEAANASSVHGEGRRARAIIETARTEVAGSVGARPDAVIFTSSATEAAALALSPRMGSMRIGRLLIGATEHPCVLAGGRFPASAIARVPVHSSGVIDLDALERALDAEDHQSGAPMLALMLANNETGVLHPVPEAARLVKERGGLTFCDAVQALGRVPVDMAELGVDLLAVSSHKLGGPQGAGALVIADDKLRPEPLVTGGGQERRMRAGTENVAAIAGFGVAARAARHHLGDAARLAGLRDRLERGLVEIAPEVRIFGSAADRLPNTTMLGVPGLAAATLVIAFDLAGVAVSAGSACSSGKVAASHVLEAMGQRGDMAHGGVRVSLTGDATERDVDTFISAWSVIHARMSRNRAA